MHWCFEEFIKPISWSEEPLMLTPLRLILQKSYSQLNNPVEWKMIPDQHKVAYWIWGAAKNHRTPSFLRDYLKNPALYNLPQLCPWAKHLSLIRSRQTVVWLTLSLIPFLYPCMCASARGFAERFIHVTWICRHWSLGFQQEVISINWPPAIREEMCCSMAVSTSINWRLCNGY